MLYIHFVVIIVIWILSYYGNMKLRGKITVEDIGITVITSVIPFLNILALMIYFCNWMDAYKDCVVFTKKENKE